MNWTNKELTGLATEARELRNSDNGSARDFALRAEDCFNEAVHYRGATRSNMVSRGFDYLEAARHWNTPEAR
jgi:hypothetical protein